jgi:hypothetical protein
MYAVEIFVVIIAIFVVGTVFIAVQDPQEHEEESAIDFPDWLEEIE